MPEHEFRAIDEPVQFQRPIILGNDRYGTGVPLVQHMNSGIFARL